jgi:hydroxymethylpyrimidine/phosphomethylpyrimidine kinase
VLDPVMVATSGDPLLDEDAVDALRDELIPLATLITPNLKEAALLLGEPEDRRERFMEGRASRLLDLGARAVVLKGGDSDGDMALDIFIDERGGMHRLEAPRVATENTHGTGCTFSSAIAAELAKGAALDQAVKDAKVYVTAAIMAADELEIGKGRGPVHHFHDWWNKK